jgi:hypothetical protein
VLYAASQITISMQDFNEKNSGRVADCLSAYRWDPDCVSISTSQGLAVLTMSFDGQEDSFVFERPEANVKR